MQAVTLRDPRLSAERIADGAITSRAFIVLVRPMSIGHSSAFPRRLAARCTSGSSTGIPFSSEPSRPDDRSIEGVSPTCPVVGCIAKGITVPLAETIQ